MKVGFFFLLTMGFSIMFFHMEKIESSRERFLRYNGGEYMRKDFIFKVGMEFCSLKEFKQTLKEYLVQNERIVDF